MYFVRVLIFLYVHFAFRIPRSLSTCL